MAASIFHGFKSLVYTIKVAVIAVEILHRYILSFKGFVRNA
jgi:hypothetical protein